MYWTTFKGPTWAAGTAALGTRVATCIPQCGHDWDCPGIPVGDCDPWSTCGDFKVRCIKAPSDVEGVYCNKCASYGMCLCKTAGDFPLLAPATSTPKPKPWQ